LAVEVQVCSISAMFYKKLTPLFFAVVSAAAPMPDILYILLDDFGWADAGWHRPQNYTDVQTPNMDALVREGVELDRHYAFKYCSPTRSAIQSGRNPIHVNVLNIKSSYNPKDPVSGYSQIPRNMTGIAEHLLRANYETHMYGKWHAGDTTPQHTPHGRGYQKSLCYLGGGNDYWTSRHGKCGKTEIVDLWATQGPAHGLNNTPSCSQKNQNGYVYEDQLFLNKVMEAVEERNPTKPLFIFWAPHIVHTPLQVPNKELERFSFISDGPRRHYHAMVYWVDEAIGTVTRKIKEKGTWNNTLFIVHADNGGPIYIWGYAGGNNYPLKGGKRSNWEGGVRVNAFVSGGLLPQKVRGTKQEGLMAAWDWYATLAFLAGVDPTDTRAQAASLPPIDSHNMWPLISGQVSQSPRRELALGDTKRINPHIQSATRVGGLISGDYKILVGFLSQSGWTAPVYPTSGNHSWNPDLSWERCGYSIFTGCLFNITADPGEHINLARRKPIIFKTMLNRLRKISKTAFSPDRGQMEPPARCQRALQAYGGFWGPYVGLSDDPASKEGFVQYV